MRLLPSSLWLLCLAAVGTSAQDDTTSSSDPSSTSSAAAVNVFDFSFTNSFSTLTADIPTSAFTGSSYVYLSPTGQTTVSTITETLVANGTLETLTTTSTASQNSQITISTHSVSLTVINGITHTMSNSTATSTSSSAAPTNTVPCNGWPEFCARKYSNISQVVAHNAAFAMKNNAASNQALPIRTQLDDGIRMLSGEVHYRNKTLFNCHTSCEILNAGTWQEELETVRDWLNDNPYDVVTLLIVNSDFKDVENFVPPIVNAGLERFLYTPSFIPQYLDQWPTLGEMIIKGQRLVIFMDYQANQKSVPYILDEFTHMWETPFSPTDNNFPCDQERPPKLSEEKAREQYMYLANHNLNLAVDLSSLGITTSSEILIPDTTDLNTTNSALNETGALARMSLNCTTQWGRPPNWLLVDYYNVGTPENGSVFHVAAAANGVKYTKECCGIVSGAARPVMKSSLVGLTVALAGAVLMVL